MSESDSNYNKWMKPYLKKAAQEEANNYDNLNFFKKSKNVLVAFYVIIVAISFGLSRLIELPDIDVGLILYLVLMPFIYLNHRWAIVIMCVMYLIDKIYFISLGMGYSISHIIFGYLCFSLSVGAYRVATELTKLETGQRWADLKEDET